MMAFIGVTLAIGLVARSAESAVWAKVHGKVLASEPPGSDTSLNLLAPINGLAYGQVGVRLDVAAPVTVTIGPFVGPAMIPAGP